MLLMFISKLGDLLIGYNLLVCFMSLKVVALTSNNNNKLRTRKTIAFLSCFAEFSKFALKLTLRLYAQEKSTFGVLRSRSSFCKSLVQITFSLQVILQLKEYAFSNLLKFDSV